MAPHEMDSRSVIPVMRGTPTLRLGFSILVLFNFAVKNIFLIIWYYLHLLVLFNIINNTCLAALEGGGGLVAWLA